MNRGRPFLKEGEGLGPENRLSNEVIGGAIEVHQTIGPGALERIYQDALEAELLLRGLEIEREVPVPVFYKGQRMGADLRVDLLVGGRVIVEVKACTEVLPVHEAQILSYLKLASKRVGLLINFHETKVVDGVKRFVETRSQG